MKQKNGFAVAGTVTSLALLVFGAVGYVAYSYVVLGSGTTTLIATDDVLESSTTIDKNGIVTTRF